MKKFIVAIFACVLACSSFVANALEHDSYVPEKVIQITKKSVNVRATPDGNVLYQAPIGTLFEVLAKEGTWYKVKEAYTGNTVYVSSSVAQLLTGEEVYDVLMLRYVYGDEDTSYYHTTHSKGGDMITQLSFEPYETKELGQVVKLTWNNMLAYPDGRSQANETYYLGYIRGWYIVLTHTQSSWNDEITPLETPIIMYGAAWETVDLYCNGVLYNGIDNDYYQSR